MKEHFINGKFCPSNSHQFIDVLDPSTGQVIEQISRGDASDVNAAVQSARMALKGEWGNKNAAERSRILMKISETVLFNKEELASIEAKDTGKPIELARKDIETLARYFEYYAGAADKVHGMSIPYLNDYSVVMVRERIGVVGHIIPWNYPAQMLGRTLAPALAMGNASVVKPAEDACLTSLRFLELATEAGLPQGAANIVTGYGHEAGAALSAHPLVEMITFTGSPQAGVQVQKAAAEHYARCVLELGGKSPQIVFEDADLEKALPILVNGLVQNAGQTCSAGTRILVQESIYEKLKSLLADRFNALVCGAPDSSPDCGPIITKAQFGRVKQFIQECYDSKLPKIAEGSINPHAPEGGFYVAPVLFGPVPRDHKLATEEVFGPVLALIPFKDESDAVELANSTDYGLVASIWSENGARQKRVAKQLDAGQVFFNCYGAGGGVELPFGGVRKSGYGREKGFIALEEFSRIKTLVDYHG
ncbi:aldehyde dehydrogenase family protein [Acinetobacter pittii]|uniref:aldehyde dehydrogenase family protein n=1 Tax=Acinetobacter pittii TaxID=48296 RepID=UPI002E76F9D6|nr:aldehyde dehydrogenase family protein [Acinetobacter pittii]WVH57861.1 aldehyde dehydrogenase family protein [Acinetobacter pittii]